MNDKFITYDLIRIFCYVSSNVTSTSSACPSTISYVTVNI